MYWLDYSAAKLPGSVIKAAGYGGVIRYIDAPDRLRTKHTTIAEYRDHIAHGLQVRLVMQNTTTDADGGWNAGVANANRAKAGANMLGYGGVIFFTNDRTTVPNPAAWRSYLDGAASVLGPGRVGAYGFANAMDLAVGHAAAFWQAGRRSDVRAHTNFWQDNNTQVTVGGITCDRNLVLAPEPNSHQEDDMQLTDLVPTVNQGETIEYWRQQAEDHANLWTLRNNMDAQNAQLAGLTAAIGALSTDPTLTKDAITQIVRDAVRDNIQITGTVNIGGKQL